MHIYVVGYEKQKENLEEIKAKIQPMLLADMPVSPAGAFKELKLSLILSDCATPTTVVFVITGATPSSPTLPSQSIISGEDGESSALPIPFHTHRHRHS